MLQLLNFALYAPWVPQSKLLSYVTAAKVANLTQCGL